MAAVEAEPMKLPFKSVGISTFAHSTESVKKLKQTLRNLLPEEIEIEISEAEGHYGDPISIISARLQNNPHLREFWRSVLKRVSEKEKKRIADESLDRISEDCRLYLRFDKQSLVSNDSLKLVDSGDVIHVRINISAYPAKKDIAIEKMKEFIENGFGNS